MASGVALRLVRSGFRVCITELPEPLAVRRGVSFCEAVFAGRSEVEGLVGRRVVRQRRSPALLGGWGSAGRHRHRVRHPQGPVARCRGGCDPGQAKHRHDPRRCAPGHRAGPRVSCRKGCARRRRDKPRASPGKGDRRGRGRARYGHPRRCRRLHLGEGSAGTGRGRFRGKKQIGETVEKGEVVAEVDGVPLEAAISGVLRGILHDGLTAEPNMKVGDMDPRGTREHCLTVSEKARAIGGAVLEAVLRKYNR